MLAAALGFELWRKTHTDKSTSPSPPAHPNPRAEKIFVLLMAASLENKAAVSFTINVSPNS